MEGPAYTLVLQSDSEGGLDALDWIVEVEQTIERGLNDGSIVDGHDLGPGEVNVFIFSDSPRENFSRCEEILLSENRSAPDRSAFRPTYAGNWTVLSPDDLPDGEFSVV